MKSWEFRGWEFLIICGMGLDYFVNFAAGFPADEASCPFCWEEKP